jgi:hypothetical protein
MNKKQLMSRLLAPVLLASILAACGGGGEAQKTAAVLSGDAKSAAANNPRCQLFTPAEVARYIGETVSAGANAAAGAGCQWRAADGSGNVIVSIVPSDYHAQPSAVPGFKELPIGVRGFVAPETGGWTAGAIVGKEAIVLSVVGAAATEANTVALLKDAIGRHASTGANGQAATGNRP